MDVTGRLSPGASELVMFLSMISIKPLLNFKGVGLATLTGEAKRLMGMVAKYDQDNYPEMLGHICIINAPAVFRMIWSVVKSMGVIDPRTQGKIEASGGNSWVPSMAD